jgi:hypothetical protein
MRTRVVKPLGLALLLAGVSFGLGQDGTKRVRVEEEELPKKKVVERKEAPAKSKLEEMLAEALKNNPDIRVAIAKAAEAEAELNRTRLQVTQKLVALYYAIEMQQITVAHQEKKLQRVQNMAQRAAVSAEEVEEARQALTLAKAKLSELEAQMPALLGKTGLKVEGEGTNALGSYRRQLMREWEKGLNAADLDLKAQDRRKVQGPLVVRVRKALETPIKVDYKSVKLPDALRELQKAVPGLPINDLTGREDPITLRFEEALPVSSILQALADFTGIQFFVREYGILAINGNGPPGAVTVQEFMRQKPAEQSKLHNPPAENVEGLVKQVDSSGLMVISIGSDAGLTKGHTLELFRLAEQPSKSKYLGTIRILEAKPKESVGQPVGRMAETPQVGDRVASRLLGK